MNDNAPPEYRGLDRFVARKRIVADLEAQGLLERITEHTSMIPKGDRSGVVIEQSPEPGTPLSDRESATVKLGRRPPVIPAGGPPR